MPCWKSAPNYRITHLGFLGIIWRTCGSKCGGEGGGIFPTLCVECCLVIHIMAGHAIVVAKDITLLFHHRNAVILTLWLWLNGGKWFVWCKFNYINNHLWLVKNNNHLKKRHTELCNFLTKRAWVSQQCTLVVAKDSNISHYLNSWAYLVMIILAII